MEAVEKVGDLTPEVLQELLRRSLASQTIRVTHVQDPQGLGGININIGHSELKKIVVTVEEDGKTRKLHLVVKAALLSGAAWGIVILGLFYFSRETFWYDAALPELMRLVSTEQAAALAEVVPRVHYTHCNYRQVDREGCLLSRAVTCCCCVLMTKFKEKGIILMDNLKEGDGDTYVDLKEIERTSGGGVKTSHMKMILKALAHFHGAWMVWLRGGGGMADLSREQVMGLYKPLTMMQWKWIWKWTLKKIMGMYVTLAEAKKDDNMKEKMTRFINAPESVDNFMKAWDFKDSKFKTICHNDLWTSQIMMSLHEDGSPKQVKILDYQLLVPGHPALDIWDIIYSATDAAYRAQDMEEDLRAYYAILSGYMEDKVDYAVFRQELADRRVKGVVMTSLSCLATLSPTKLPSPASEINKFVAVATEMLVAEETAEDHPDLKEMRRRVMSNCNEMVDLNLI